jgi:outer membrane protein assembly factor BamB
MLAACITAVSLEASVNVRPHFGHPYIFGDRIVFTSVDGRELICIDFTGRPTWNYKFSQRITVQRAEGEKLLVQDDRKVLVIDAANGTKTVLAKMPRNEILEIDPDADFACASRQSLTDRLTRILDPRSLAELWRTDAIESFVHVGRSTIVAVQATRVIGKDESFQLKDVMLVGLKRDDGALRWSMPLPGSQLGFVDSLPAGRLLAIRVGGFSPELFLLDPDSGQVISRPEVEADDMDVEGERLVVLERVRGPGEVRVFTCELPACAERSEPVVLIADEILKFRLYRDYVITAGIYNCAAFSRTTGKRLWTKGQLEWSEPVGDSMIVTDHDRKTKSARIVSVALATGDERVLFTRAVTKRDEKDFRPW